MSIPILGGHARRRLGQRFGIWSKTGQDRFFASEWSYAYPIRSRNKDVRLYRSAYGVWWLKGDTIVTVTPDQAYSKDYL